MPGPFYPVDFEDAAGTDALIPNVNAELGAISVLVIGHAESVDSDIRTTTVESFDRHMAGIQANRYVREFGLRLLPRLYEVYNPMPYEGAREMEVELAIGLREQGYGVWQA